MCVCVCVWAGGGVCWNGDLRCIKVSVCVCLFIFLYNLFHLIGFQLILISVHSTNINWVYCY